MHFFFRGWISWCSARSADPISCSVGEVVIFLADLFSQGYQYRSLNTCRYHTQTVLTRRGYFLSYILPYLNNLGGRSTERNSFSLSSYMHNVMMPSCAQLQH